MWIAAREDRHGDALEHSLQAQDLFRAAGNQAGQARVLTDIAYGHAALGRYEQALGYCEQALARARELGERSWEDVIWDTFGFIHRRLGDYQQSVTCYRQALEICRESGDRFNEAACLDVLGDTYQDAGSDDDARQAWSQALRIFDEVGHPDADELRAKLQPPGARTEFQLGLKLPGQRVHWSLPAAGAGVLGMATRPHRHHASRRSSSVQAMAYTMATNRHITPKPGQGWRVWAEW